MRLGYMFTRFHDFDRWDGMGSRWGWALALVDWLGRIVVFIRYDFLLFGMSNASKVFP
jgi:hypothetical protein